MTEPPNRIRELRKAGGWTLQQLADRIGCGTTHLSNLERGERALNYYWMKRIARVFKVEVAELLLLQDNSSALSPGARDLVALYEQADDAQRRQLLQLARIIVAPKS